MKKLLFTIFTISVSCLTLMADEIVPAVSKNTSGNDSLPLGIIGTILGAVALGLACFTFINLSKRISKSESDKKKDNVLQVRLKILEENSRKLEERVNRLERSINTAKVVSKPQSVSSSQSYPSHSTPVSRHQDVSVKPDSYVLDNANMNQQKHDYREERTHTYIHEEVRKQEIPETKVEPMKLIENFVGIPEDGEFTVVEDEYIPGETIFEIQSYDGKSGNIQFTNRRETISLASRNLSRWLEPVCEIMGEIPDTLTRVKTTTPGQVEKTPTGWRLKSKAIVELS